MMNKNTVDLASASTQHKECGTDAASTNSGSPANTNEDESTANDNLSNRTKSFLNA